MKTGVKLNKYGTLVSVHLCIYCKEQFTICPSKERDSGCQCKACISYKEENDVDKLFIN